MKRLIGFLIFFALIAIFISLHFYGSPLVLLLVIRVLLSLATTFFLISYLYLLFKKHTKNSLLIPSFIIFSIPLAAFLFVFWGGVGYAAEVYKGKYLNSKPVKYVGQFLQSDQILGISNKPGKEAYLKYFDKTDTVFIDKNAFRVSKTNFYLQAHNLSDTSLFLGCSFTFGFFCKTDSIYPEIVCRQINSYCMNGGTNSFGLAQMQMLAEKYIPEFKPKRVIVQYSSWLPWRSKLYYLPISSALVPNPYYFKKNNEIYIAPPLFVTSFYDLNLPENRPDSFKYIYLSATRILPFYFHEIYQKIKVGLMLRLKLKPQSHNNLDELAQAGYTKIYRLVKNYGGMMYLVSIGNGMSTTCPNYFKNEKENFCFVNADSTLYNGAHSADYFEKRYCHSIVQGNDTVVFDKHFNHFANALIAQSIVQKINEYEKRLQR